MTFRISLLAMISLVISATMALSQNIQIGHQYARAASPIAKTGAAFMHIMNMGDEDDQLIAVITDAARNPELHTHIMEDGIAKMREVEGGFTVPAGGATILERGGLHIMMMGLTQRFVQGEMISLTLVFEKAGEVTIEVPIDNERQETPMDHSTMDHSE